MCNIFSRLKAYCAHESTKDIQVISSLRRIKNDLYEEVRKFQSHILRISHASPIIFHSPYRDSILKNYSLLNWDSPHFNHEENSLANDELKKLFFFNENFFNDSEKNLCKEDLLKFE